MMTPAERVKDLSAQVTAAHYRMLAAKLTLLTDEDLLASLAGLEATFVSRVAELQHRVEALELRLRGLPAEDLES